MNPRQGFVERLEVAFTLEQPDEDLLRGVLRRLSLTQQAQTPAVDHRAEALIQGCDVLRVRHGISTLHPAQCQHRTPRFAHFFPV